MLVKHISERPTPVNERRPDVPTDLTRVVMTLLEKDPSNRFPSAQALVAALDTGVMPPLPARDTRTSTNASPMALATRTSADAYPAEIDPTAEDLRRWNAPVVHQFRRKLAPYIAVNVVILIMGLFTGVDLYGLTAIWSVTASSALRITESGCICQVRAMAL